MIRLKPSTLITASTKPSWLLIVPAHARHPQDSVSLYWGQCQPGSSLPLEQWGQLDDNSAEADWQALAQLSQQSRTLLLLPANEVSFFQIAAPKGVKPKEWPLLLEEVTPSDPEHLVIAAIKDGAGHHTEPGTLALMVTDRDRLTAWQYWAQSRNIKLQHWSCPLHLQPEPATPDALSLTGDHTYWMIKSSSQWLCWPRALEAQLPPQWQALTQTTHWDIQHDSVDQWLNMMARQLPCDCPRIPALRQPGLTSRKWRTSLASSTSHSDHRPLKRHLLVVALLGLSHWGLTAAQQWQAERTQATQQAKALAARDIPPQQAASVIHQRLGALDAQQQRQRQIEALVAEVKAQLPSDWPALSQLSVNADHIALTWSQDSTISSENRTALERLGSLDISPTAITLRRSLNASSQGNRLGTTAGDIR